jgi:alcohol dehydrogenase
VNVSLTEVLRRPVRYGDGAIVDAAEIVSARGAARVLLVTGKRSFEASGADRLLPGLEAVADVRRWSDFRPNTDAQDLVVGLRVVEDFRPDLVLAVGGGSAMDMAKLLCAYRGTTDEDALLEDIRAGVTVEVRRMQLVLAPTTSGSGAEATRFAVVYIRDEKFSIAGPAMLPDAVVLDPSLTTSGSRYQRATSGIDAVAQAIESLWATGATERSRGFARHALRLLLPNIEPFVNEADAGASRRMALGSHLAGRAIDISKTTAAHALSYGITKGYGVSHGHAVALTLGAFIGAHADASSSSLQPGIASATHAQSMQVILDLFKACDGTEAADNFAALLERIGLNPSLAAAGLIDEEQRKHLVTGVNAERLGNNPVLFDEAGLQEILEQAYRRTSRRP